MEKNNIISDWLDQYGNPEIDKFIETQLNQNKMTAVEQLVSNIRALAYDKRHHLGMGDIRITQGLLDELEEQAKEMEKEQIMNAWDDGQSDGATICTQKADNPSEEYYNETFK